MSETKLIARPWQPQDLLDELQLMIDEQPNNYLSEDRNTLCMAKAYLEEYFAEPKWISVVDQLPRLFSNKVIVHCKNGYVGFGHYEEYRGNKTWYNLENGRPFSAWECEEGDYEVTHWMCLPNPPKEEQK